MKLRRIRNVTFAELNWRAREYARTSLDRVRSRVSPPRWQRDEQTESIAASVVERLRTQPARFIIDPSNASQIRNAVRTRWPAVPHDAAAHADRILTGHYDLLGYRGLDVRQADGAIDWHVDPVHHRRAPRVCWADVPYLDPAIGDHKIIWELNRHQHWLQLGRAWWLTGDPKYAAAIVEQLENWLDANPPLTGINWASMLEIGFRTISWTAALHFLSAGSGQQAADSENFVSSSAGRRLPAASFLSGIDRQLTHLERHLSYYFSPNTHLTGEALALYVVGSALPELPASGRWVATGRRILLDQIDRQILPDGGHAERSTHYQRYTLDFYLLALLTARRTGDIDAERTFAAVVSRLADFTRAIADDDGRLPLIGDDDGGMLWPLTGRDCNDVRDSLAIAAVVLERPELATCEVPEEAAWIAWPETRSTLATEAQRHGDVAHSSARSVTLHDTGYVVLRNSSGAHAVFDVGAHGYMNGGHAHADALALTLSVGGRPLLVDPGTSTYTMDSELRDRMRSSFSHNTVTIDGRPQSTPAGPFHWHSSAAAQLHASRHNAGFDWVEGLHDGYAPIAHRRSIVRAHDAGWLIVDSIVAESRTPLAPSEVEGNPESRHSLTNHWHFHPNWMVHSYGEGRLRATHLDGGDAWLLFDGGEISLQHGNEESGRGWFAPVYGTLIPTWNAQLSRNATLPAAAVTWISECAPTVMPLLKRIGGSDTLRDAVAARVTAADAASLYLIHVGAASACDSRAARAGEYQTNARVLHARTRSEALLTLDLVDASHALSLREGWISVAAHEPVSDLHLSVADGVLLLAASEPPRELRLEGRALADVSVIVLNGRSFEPRPLDRPDTLLLSGGDWGLHSAAHVGAPFATDAVRLNGCEEFLPLRESSW